VDRSQPAKADLFLCHLEPLQGRLEAFGRRSLYDIGALADVLQSAVANAFRDFHHYAEGTNFRAWIFRYVHLEICNRNRQSLRDRHQELPAELAEEASWRLLLDEPLYEVLLEDPDIVLEQCDDALAEAVRALPDGERAVFLLRVIGEFKYREIAEILDKPLGTVMSYLARSRLRLRERLTAYGEEQGLLKRPVQ
jgi:RNA polymerase sigma-70 factor (ECF subfamily)